MVLLLCVSLRSLFYFCLSFRSWRPEPVDQPDPHQEAVPPPACLADLQAQGRGHSGQGLRCPSDQPDPEAVPGPAEGQSFPDHADHLPATTVYVFDHPAEAVHTLQSTKAQVSFNPVSENVQIWSLFKTNFDKNHPYCCSSKIIKAIYYLNFQNVSPMVWDAWQRMEEWNVKNKIDKIKPWPKRYLSPIFPKAS